MERMPRGVVPDAAPGLTARAKRFRLLTFGRMALLETMTVEEPTLAALSSAGTRSAPHSESER